MRGINTEGRGSLNNEDKKEVRVMTWNVGGMPADRMATLADTRTRPS